VDRIAAMVSLRPVASPNFVRLVYDGDNSTGGGAAGPPGSEAIEELFADYFERQSLPTEPLSLADGVDHPPFSQQDIPVGGLYAGQTEIKSARQQGIFGGTAGVAFDPCADEACDVLDNVNNTVLDQLADAAAHVILLLSRRNLAKSPLASP
jgi:hypothetical protein